MLHILTIVINGKPFIDRHLPMLEKLPIPWHWHIVEGLADLKGCTGWSLSRGGRLPGAEFHNNCLSIDGTTEYLDSIRKHPNVSVYSTPGKLWDGKKEMVNLALSYMDEPGVLMEIDVDEMWNTDQVHLIHELLNTSDASAAWFWCRFWVGPGLRLDGRGGYANNPGYEWIRAWKYEPGMIFVSHEPPCLVKPGFNGDLAKKKPLNHFITEKYGLVFDHYAYLTEPQVAWKELYYGYGGAVAMWKQLQSHNHFPVEARRFMPWVYDGTPIVKDVMPHSF